MEAIAATQPPGPGQEIAMAKPIFGLSTTPVKDIRSELREQLERDLLALVYADRR
jgi:hypothetical protein